MSRQQEQSEPNTKDRKKFHQIKLNPMETTNLPIGDDIKEDTDVETILFHNVNGIKEESNWYQILTTMKELRVDIFGFAEINRTLQHGTKQKWEQVTRKFFNHSRTINSESDIQTDNYKPGGTLTTITGKWQARISEKGGDNSGLGRWSFFRISSNKKSVIIVTAYRPCHSTGPSTSWMQQWTLLREAGNKNPDPIKAFYSDLQESLSKWKQLKYEIILMIDANETIGDKPGGLAPIFNRVGLIDLIHHQHKVEDNVNTYVRGSKRIDYILGTHKVKEYCTHSGMLPFGVGYQSDHRALFIKVDLQKILQTTVTQLDTINARKLTQATPKERLIFLEQLDLHYRNQNLYQRLRKLTEIEDSEWTTVHKETYEQCDKIMVEGMLSAESKTKKVHTTSWSPIFAKAVSQKSFWKIALSIKINHRRASQEYLKWAREFGIDDFYAIDLQTIKKNFRESQKNLKKVENKADQLREDHLRSLLTDNELNGDEKKIDHRIKILIRAHERKQHFSRLKLILKPKEAGGLSYILVPEDFNIKQFPYDPNNVQTWEAIHDQEKIQQFIRKRNLIHFGQAQGTPFTIQPLAKIGWQANSPTAKELLQGVIPLDLLSDNPNVKKILKYMAERPNLPTIEAHITKDEISRGFRRWRESTSTSPSGCHLGLRRITTIPCDEPIMDDIRNDILQVQTDIINLPIKNGFSPQRWRTVVNAMLEKITGKPMLHKLRVIHILEADYNLALKQIFGRRLLKNCELHDTLGDLQDGFRKGRSTIRTLLLNEITNDYNKRLRINNYVGTTDISGCFDCIVTPVISLINIKNGCPPKAVEMHSTTLEKARYHLKTRSGISPNYYQHSEETPVHGNGQGAGDSPSQWCQQSAMLFDIYAESHKGTTMSSRSGKFSVQLPMAAFADDTNLLGNDDDRSKTPDQLAEQAQNSFTTWNELLHASGHFMELDKCSCYLSIWDFQEDGYAYTLPPDKLEQQIIIYDLQNKPQQIELIHSEKSQKLLGVMRNPIGNQQDEISRLKDKSNSIATKVNLNAITSQQAKMAYESFYIPAMRYSLAITSINQMDFDIIQKKATTSFLSTMGFNCHMPREVVYCSKAFQGLGLKHLYDIQGSDSVKLLLQELNHHGTTGNMIRHLLEVIQMESGIGCAILENNRPLSYIEWGWTPAIRDFLFHIKAKITNATRTPPTFRVNDSYIMDSPYLMSLTRKEQILINRCRLFLQVECMSDITNADGSRIREEWMAPDSVKPSRSLKNWPIQGNPGVEAWKIWRNFINRGFLKNDKCLITPLGGWERGNGMRIHRAYLQPKQNLLWIYREENRWTTHSLTYKGRRQITFGRRTEQTFREPPLGFLPIDILGQTEEQYITGCGGTVARKQIIKTEATTLTKKLAQRSSETLLHNIKLKIDEEELQEILSQPAYIDIATDGSLDPNTGISSYGWAIMVNDFVTATGQGPVEAHPEMADPLRAEAYGLASSASFLEILTDHYQLEPTDHVWTIYLDNTSLIKQMETIPQDSMTPKWNFVTHADIIKTAHLFLRKFPIIYTYVKAHQDRSNKNKELSRAASLNIMADNLAQQQRHTMKTAHSTVTTMHAHLCINDITITKECQRWIMDTASRIPIQQYYREKYHWKTTTFHKINWKAQQRVLQHYDNNDQRRILKFCHGWLPTHDRLYREQQTLTQRCPLCHYLKETNTHLFSCRHPDQRAIIKTLIKKIEQDNTTYGVEGLTEIYKEAVTSIDQEWRPSIQDETTLSTSINDQNDIGWHHILFGRIAQTTARYIDSTLHQRGVEKWQNSGDRWSQRMIKNIWDTFLQLWNSRNTITYDTNNKSKQNILKEKLQLKVERRYQYVDKLSCTDRQKLFYRDKESLLEEDPRFIKAWLKLADRIIRVSKQESKRQYREIIFMEKFFHWRPSSKPSRKRKRTPHQKQDLRPD